MSELQTRQYRQRIYEKYVSGMLRTKGTGYTQQDYQKWADAAKARLHSWLPEDRNIPVLDMGCGSGQFLYLLDQLGYTDHIGVDLSGEQVALAENWCPRAKIIQGDAREVLVANPARFGLITGFDIIEHLGKDEILPFLDLVVNALRPGGRLILQTPNAESPWFGAVAYGDYTHEWFFTPSSLKHILWLSGLIEFQARASAPHVHSIKSLGRVGLWQMLNPFLMLWNLAETGSVGSGIYTRVFVATAIKSE